MDWSAIVTNVVDHARPIVRTFSLFSLLIVLIALVNWTSGGIAVFGHPAILRQSRPFVAMRWLGLIIWAGTFAVSMPKNPEHSLQLVGATVHGIAAVVMLVGTARKPFRERFMKTPSSVKSLFEDPS